MFCRRVSAGAFLLVRFWRRVYVGTCLPARFCLFLFSESVFVRAFVLMRFCWSVFFLSISRQPHCMPGGDPRSFQNQSKEQEPVPFSLKLDATSALYSLFTHFVLMLQIHIRRVEDFLQDLMQRKPLPLSSSP